MDNGTLTWLGQAVLAAVAWLSGEIGRVVIAGAAGGMFRWLGQEKRHLRDGVLAVLTGVLAALYLPPLLVAFLAVWGVDISLEGQGAQSIGFLAGMIGMSFAKWVTAFVEYRMHRALSGDNSDE